MHKPGITASNDCSNIWRKNHDRRHHRSIVAGSESHGDEHVIRQRRSHKQDNDEVNDQRNDTKTEVREQWFALRLARHRVRGNSPLIPAPTMTKTNAVLSSQGIASPP